MIPFVPLVAGEIWKGPRSMEEVMSGKDETARTDGWREEMGCNLQEERHSQGQAPRIQSQSKPSILQSSHFAFSMLDGSSSWPQVEDELLLLEHLPPPPSLPSNNDPLTDDIASLLFSDDLDIEESCKGTEGDDPFFGFELGEMAHQVRSGSVIAVHDLASDNQLRPKRLEIKVIKSERAAVKPSPLRGQFGPRTRRRETDDRREYALFVRRLYADEAIDGSSEEEDDLFLEGASEYGESKGMHNPESTLSPLAYLEGEGSRTEMGNFDIESGKRPKRENTRLTLQEHDAKRQRRIETKGKEEDGPSLAKSHSESDPEPELVSIAIDSRELEELYEDDRRHLGRSIIAPANLSSAARPATYETTIMGRLNRQINIHFQLLVQTLALSGEIHDAEQIWVAALKLMIRLKDAVDTLPLGHLISLPALTGMDILTRVLKQSPLHAALLHKIKQTANDPDLRHRASVRSIPFRAKLRMGKKSVFSASFWRLFSIFGTPYDGDFCLSPVRSTSQLREMQQDGDNGCILHDGCCFSASQENRALSSSSINMMQDTKDPICTAQDDKRPINGLLVGCQHIIQEPSFLAGRRNDSFLAVEDRLLLLGLQRYGLGNWERIQSQLLPTRTAKQLSVRYKNLTARRTALNPIKLFAQEAMKPLSAIEEDLLRQGTQLYGMDFVRISEHFLPHRPATMLRRLWCDMCAAPVDNTPTVLE